MSPAAYPPRRGRDRRARVVTPVPGRDRLTVRDAPGVAVVDGDIAGLSAAVPPAERGARVTLHEGQEALGGRLSGHRTRCCAPCPPSPPAERRRTG
ncbi:hypothetical protein ACFU9F_16010 [Streptomyces zhihengii]|uniref:hypothetical protein n=1 Tax=Streptomyces zhihengii TaxID=1818004 RepID=UPI0036B996AB